MRKPRIWKYVLAVGWAVWLAATITLALGCLVAGWVLFALAFALWIAAGPVQSAENRHRRQQSARDFEARIAALRSGLTS